MDRYHDGPYPETDATPNTTSNGQRSMEARAPQTPRLQKQRSHAEVRSASQPFRSTYPRPERREAGEQDDAQQGAPGPRKGSLRHAIRRMFGKKSKGRDSAPPQRTPPRHGYHRSEPVGTLPTQPEETEGVVLGARISQRNFSVPLDLPATSLAPRTRSPYAVEFPQSSRLKPLNLGNPFNAPGSQLRRRKTLPSVLITGADAEAIKASMDSMAEPSAPEEGGRDLPSSLIGRAISTRGSDKRRSRSETDLRGASERPKVPDRKRSDEIRYWRESYQPNVLRASGFRVSSIPTGAANERQDEEKTPIPRGSDPFDTKAGAAAESSPSPQGGLNVSPMDDNSFSAIGTELSRDLEDRVSRLESGLRTFQTSLERLNADRNRRTVLVETSPEPGSVPVSGHRGRASSGRTVSILAGDLQGDLAPSTYQYDYSDTLRARPMTSPQHPRTPVDVPGNPTFPIPGPAMDDPFVTPSAPPVIPGMDHAATAPGPVPQHTFRSLYEMLNDERSARRRLEQKMRRLQEELANLHYQVSATSNVQSQRSSYMPSSTRLQALLAGTEESPPATSESQRRRFSPDTGLSLDPRVVSRFSGSESEAAPTDVDTPCGAYQTPAEEQSPGRFAFDNVQRYAGREGEMF